MNKVCPNNECLNLSHSQYTIVIETPGSRAVDEQSYSERRTWGKHDGESGKVEREKHQ